MYVRFVCVLIYGMCVCVCVCMYVCVQFIHKTSSAKTQQTFNIFTHLQVSTPKR